MFWMSTQCKTFWEIKRIASSSPWGGVNGDGEEQSVAAPTSRNSFGEVKLVEEEKSWRTDILQGPLAFGGFDGIHAHAVTLNTLLCTLKK